MRPARGGPDRPEHVECQHVEELQVARKDLGEAHVQRERGGADDLKRHVRDLEVRL